MQNKSILLLDGISSFPRDIVPAGIRLKDSIPNRTEVGDIRVIKGECLLSIVDRISQKEIVIEDVREKAESGSFSVYIALGYYDSIIRGTSPNLCASALRYIADAFSSNGWTLRFVLPVIRSNRLSKDMKMCFAHIHGKIRELVAEYDFAQEMRAPLIAKDPTSPKGESIRSFFTVIGHDISIRKIKEIVQTMDTKPRVETALRSVPKSSGSDLEIIRIDSAPRRKRRDSGSVALQIVEKDRIVITEEMPPKRRRARRA